jgi:hypothetical protein
VASSGGLDARVVSSVIGRLRIRLAQGNRQWGANGSFVVGSLFKCFGQPLVKGPHLVLVIE